MQKTIATLVLSIALAGLPAFSQDQPPPNKKSDSQAGQVTLTGTVTNYDVAKSIEIEVGGVSHKYDLNESDTVYSISPEVATGSIVTVTQRTSSEGHKAISIALAPAKVSGQR